MGSASYFPRIDETAIAVFFSRIRILVDVAVARLFIREPEQIRLPSMNNYALVFAVSGPNVFLISATRSAGNPPSFA